VIELVTRAADLEAAAKATEDASLAHRAAASRRAKGAKGEAPARPPRKKAAAG
jgi:hypothetical protein